MKRISIYQRVIRMKEFLLSIGQIMINLAFTPIFFIKLFHSVAILPGYNESGELITNKTDHYYSPLDNLKTLDSSLLIYISIGIIIISIVLTIIDLIKRSNKNLKIANYLVFCLSVVFFLALLFVSVQVRRKY